LEAKLNQVSLQQIFTLLEKLLSCSHTLETFFLVEKVSRDLSGQLLLQNQPLVSEKACL